MQRDSSIAVGGTTGHCHESSAAIDEAVTWLVATPRHKRGSAVTELKQRYGLTTVEACQAIREANLRLARAA